MGQVRLGRSQDSSVPLSIHATDMVVTIKVRYKQTNRHTGKTIKGMLKITQLMTQSEKKVLSDNELQFSLFRIPSIIFSNLLKQLINHNYCQQIWRSYRLKTKN